MTNTYKESIDVQEKNFLKSFCDGFLVQGGICYFLNYILILSLEKVSSPSLVVFLTGCVIAVVLILIYRNLWVKKHLLLREELALGERFGAFLAYFVSYCIFSSKLLLTLDQSYFSIFNSDFNYDLMQLAVYFAFESTMFLSPFDDIVAPQGDIPYYLLILHKILIQLMLAFWLVEFIQYKMEPTE